MRVSSTTRAPPRDAGRHDRRRGLRGQGDLARRRRRRLQALVDSGEARPALRKLAVAHAGGRRYILVGLGERDEFDAERARVAAAAVARPRAGARHARRCAGSCPHHVDEAPRRFVEGTVLAAYAYRALQVERRRRPADRGADRLRARRRLRRVERAGDRRRGRQRRPRPAEPPGERADADRARRARARRSTGVQVEVWGREEIEAAGMGAFAAVARGSDEEPQLITIRYEPADVARAGARLRRQGRDVRLRRHLDQARR